MTLGYVLSTAKKEGRKEKRKGEREEEKGREGEMKEGNPRLVGMSYSSSQPIKSWIVSPR
jgi:hypothetical protein